MRVYWANNWRILGSVVQPSGSYPAYESIRDHARTLQGTAAEWPRTMDFQPGYTRNKRENLATKEDPAEFTRIAESIKTEHQLLIEQMRQPSLAGHRSSC